MMAVPLIINTAVLFYHHSKDELTGFRFLTYFGNDSMVLVLVGSVILLSVYGDELRSMAMTTLIGRGYSRTDIILAKFIDVVLLVIAVNIFYAVIALVLMLVFRVPLTGFETKILVFRYLMNIYDMIGNITFAAFFIFLMENSAVGVFIFLATSVLIPALIQFASNTMEFVQKFHLNRLDYNAIGNMAFSDFMLGMPGYAVLKVLIGVVVYVLTFLVLTAVFFNKKELSF